MRRPCIALLATALAALSACAPAPPPEGASPHDAAPGPQRPDVTVSPAPPASPTPPSSGPAGPSGTWRSPSCGARQYERVISFSADGTFTAEDRVSPCPPRVACIWSGIVVRKGTFARAGDAVTLTVSDASRGPGVQELPGSLLLDPAALAPVEKAPDGSLCVYER